MLQFGGFAVMPFALLVLSGYGESATAPLWIGHSSAALAFLLVGAGGPIRFRRPDWPWQRILSAKEDQPKVVGLMYVMLLLGMIASALIFGALLENYSPGRLIQVIQGAAVVTVALNFIAIWKQESRDRSRAQSTAPKPRFEEAWQQFMRNADAFRLLVIIALGTAGFGMADVLLEPYGGQALGLSVASTTKLTAIMAFGGLIGFGIASRVLGREGCPSTVANVGAVIGIPAFFAIIATFYLGTVLLFGIATLFLGIGAGLFGHGTLTATMRAAPKEQIGLALGAWGAVQATATGIAIAIGGILRDVITGWSTTGPSQAGNAYLPVFAIEIVLLALACIALAPMVRKRKAPRQMPSRI